MAVFYQNSGCRWENTAQGLCREEACVEFLRSLFLFGILSIYKLFMLCCAKLLEYCARVVYNI